MPITIIATAPRFPLGQVTATPGASNTFTPEEIATAIDWHVSGDWGEVGPEDAAENALSLKEGFRLMSAYSSALDDRLQLERRAPPCDRSPPGPRPCNSDPSRASRRADTGD
jgi:hypothetical protein